MILLVHVARRAINKRLKKIPVREPKTNKPFSRHALRKDNNKTNLYFRTVHVVLIYFIQTN
jgi:hypothetical protein